MEGELIKMQLPSLSECKIGVIGLGYVGLPVAIAFASEKKCKRTNKDLNRKVIAFDINNERINSLKKGIDKTNEINRLVISNCENILFTSNSKDLVDAENSPMKISPLHIRHIAHKFFLSILLYT